jgi:hypothetical protein
VSVTNIQGIQTQDAERQIWASCGADWAYFLIQFLRGQRRLPVQQSEIKETQLYLRSSEAEQKALLLVCDEEPRRLLYIEPEQKSALADRDNWLMLLVDGKNLGHADRVRQIAEIPQLIAAREKADRDMFPTAHYPIATLFTWIWAKVR